MIVSARDRRLLIFGSTVIGSLIGLARGIPAVRAWERQKLDDAATTTADLATARNGRRMLPILRETLSARRARLAALDSGLLSGQSPSAAVADLTAALEQFMTDARIKVSALQISTDSASPVGVVHVRVRIAGTGDVIGLAAFLRAVEGGDTPLVVRELVVAQPDPAGADSRPEALRIEALIEGIAIIRREART